MSVSFFSNALVETSDAEGPNLCNANARLLLGALRLASEDLCGDCTVAEARRAVMRARSGSLAAFTRESSSEYGVPARSDDRVVPMRGLRTYQQGLDVDGLAERIEFFAAFVERAAQLGATTISWS